MTCAYTWSWLLLKVLQPSSKLWVLFWAYCSATDKLGYSSSSTILQIVGQVSTTAFTGLSSSLQLYYTELLHPLVLFSNRLWVTLRRSPSSSWYMSRIRKMGWGGRPAHIVQRAMIRLFRVPAFGTLDFSLHMEFLPLSLRATTHSFF